MRKGKAGSRREDQLTRELERQDELVQAKGVADQPSLKKELLTDDVQPAMTEGEQAPETPRRDALADEDVELR